MLWLLIWRMRSFCLLFSARLRQGIRTWGKSRMVLRDSSQQKVDHENLEFNSIVRWWIWRGTRQANVDMQQYSLISGSRWSGRWLPVALAFRKSRWTFEDSEPFFWVMASWRLKEKWRNLTVTYRSWNRSWEKPRPLHGVVAQVAVACTINVYSKTLFPQTIKDSNISKWSSSWYYGSVGPLWAIFWIELMKDFWCGRNFLPSVAI